MCLLFYCAFDILLGKLHQHFDKLSGWPNSENEVNPDNELQSDYNKITLDIIR